VRLSPANNAKEQAFRHDLFRMAEPEKHAQKFAKDAFDQLQNHQIALSEFADRIERDVLPQWTMIQESFERDRVPADSKLKPLWELLNDYSESRLAAYKLFDSGARHGRTADFKQAEQKLELGQIDLKLIKDLQHGE
jgi:hypothetical protein